MDSGQAVDRFNVGGIFSYLLPGIAITTGLFVLARLCDFHHLSFNDLNWFTGILFFFMSWIAGIVFSGLSDQLIQFLYWIMGVKPPSEKIPLQALRTDLSECFRREFNIRVKNMPASAEYLQLMKSYVDQFMPVASRACFRLNERRMLKGYFILPVFVWTINAVMLCLTLSDAQDQFILLLSSVAGGYSLIISLWFSAKRDATNEIGTLLISFIALSKSGITRSL